MWRKTKPSTVVVLKSSPESCKESTVDTSMAKIALITSSAAAFLPFLPYEYIDNNRVPTVIFKGMPSVFQSFILFIMFGFSISLSGLFINKHSKVVRCYGDLSKLSVAAAVAMLLYAISATALR